MKLVHRNIFKELLSIFGLSVCCLLGLIIMGRMLQLRELFMSQNLGIMDLLQLFIFLCPFFMLLITPIACMLSVFLVFLRMNTDNEAIALKANGVSLYQLLPAPLAFSLLCTVLTFVVSFVGVSWGMDMFKAKIVEYARTRSKLAIQAGVFNRDFPNLTFYAKQVDSEKGEMRFVFVEDRTLKDTSVVIVAPYGRVETNPKEGEVGIVFRNGRIFRQHGDELNILQFGRYKVRLPLGKLLGGFSFDRDKPKEMSFFDLWELYRTPNDRMLHDTNYARKLETEFVKRWALPFGCLILGMFAFPIASVFRGLRQQYGLMLSMGLFLVYYSLFSVGTGLGEAGTLSPYIGLWLPNILFAIIAWVGIYYANMEKTIPLVTLIEHWRAKRAES
ncbi:LPS export ABC transporter permease LptF [Salidesulfovibrio onnuriiensis]|uniref:LPS export ABC transporter permease LptF n=1 Tax=Salidesulfovibrio onnuriiensis TaxID=2583823 RepID=UPI0011CAB121|nr:LPS export ABC transporter permease LptF [Salidesulfovibrio onnuriiensis]